MKKAAPRSVTAYCPSRSGDRLVSGDPHDLGIADGFCASRISVQSHKKSREMPEPTTEERLRTIDALIKSYEADRSIYPSTLKSLISLRARLKKDLAQD